MRLPTTTVSRSTASSMSPGQGSSTSRSEGNSWAGALKVAPDPAPTPPFIGIDLGCSHSVVAVYLGNGNVEVIPNDIGNRTTPSVVAFLGAERLVGEAAVVQAAINPCATVRNVKRVLGRSLESILEEEVPALGSTVTVVEDEVVNNQPLLKLKPEQSSGHESIRPEEVAAMLLSSLKKSAEQFLKQEVAEASIAVPAYFDAAQRLAVQQSGVIAGFKRVRLVNDTSATALTFAVDRADSRRVVVVDVGGGGGSVSVAEVSLNGFVKVLATFDERIPGGNDLDARVLADLRKDIFGESHHLSTERTSEILLSSWTKAKEKLIHRQETNLKVYLPGVNKDFDKVLKWENFRGHLEPMLQSVERALEDVLKESKTTKKQVSDVLLVGGCSRIPILRSAVRNFFDGKEPCRAVNADEGVASGAALYAASLSKDKSVESVLEDITPLEMRIRSKGRTFTIVRRNEPVPSRITPDIAKLLYQTDCFQVEQSGPPDWKIVCDVARLSGFRPPSENVHFLSRDGLLVLSMGNTKYELKFRACLTNYYVKLLKEQNKAYFRMEDERNQRNEEKNRLENLLRDLQARQVQLDEMKAKQFLKELVDPAMEWFLSDQTASTESYEERFSSIVDKLTSCEGVLPDTPEWKAYLHELKNSRDSHVQSGGPERKRPKHDQAETEPRRVKIGKGHSEYALRSTGVETRLTNLASKPPENAGKPSDFQPHKLKSVTKKQEDAGEPSNAQPIKSESGRKQSENVEKPSYVQPESKGLENSNKLSHVKAMAKSANLSSKQSENPGTPSRASIHDRKNGSNEQGDADTSTKQVHHRETSVGRRQESRSTNKHSDDTETGHKKRKGIAEASGADPGDAVRARVRHLVGRIHMAVFTKAAKSQNGVKAISATDATDKLEKRVAAQEPEVRRLLAKLALRRVMAEVREAGPFCLMLYSITTKRGHFVAMMVRYCTPGYGCTPVERLLALLDGEEEEVSADALFRRFTELCDRHGFDWRSTLLALSTGSVKSLHGELHSLHELLQRQAKRDIRLVWDSSTRVGDLMAMDFDEKFEPGRKFFIAVDCFRDLFRHERRRADLARHCKVDVKALEFASYEDTIFFIYKHYQEAKKVLGKLKDAPRGYAVQASHLFDCFNDIHFLAILEALRRVFKATEVLTKRLKDSIPVGLAQQLCNIRETRALSETDKDASIFRILGDVLGNINDKFEHDEMFESRKSYVKLIKHILDVAGDTIDRQLSHCHDLFMDIDCLGQVLVSGNSKILPDNLLKWVPELQGEREREKLFSEMNEIGLPVTGQGPSIRFSHCSILRSPVYPSVALGLRALLTLPLIPVERGVEVTLRSCLQSRAFREDLEASTILICASMYSYQGMEAREYDEAADEFIKTIGIL